MTNFNIYNYTPTLKPAFFTTTCIFAVATNSLCSPSVFFLSTSVSYSSHQALQLNIYINYMKKKKQKQVSFVKHTHVC